MSSLNANTAASTSLERSSPLTADRIQHASRVAGLGAWAQAKAHLPEYAIEAFLLGMFMVSAGVVAVALDAPVSPLRGVIESDDLRRALAGIAMGVTAIALIYSPWGKRSGAHMNPAVTLAFLTLRRVKPLDALLYIAAHCIGGTIGVLLVYASLGEAFSEPPVSFVATLPARGAGAAFAAEFLISFGLMLAVLYASSSMRLAKYTGWIAGLLVAAYIAVEAPYSGMSMNPARTFASAVGSGHWMGFWIYLVAPIAAMQAAAFVHARTLRAGGCAKLAHAPEQRCIHCGHQPL